MRVAPTGHEPHSRPFSRDDVESHRMPRNDDSSSRFSFGLPGNRAAAERLNALGPQPLGAALTIAFKIGDRACQAVSEAVHHAGNISFFHPGQRAA